MSSLIDAQVGIVVATLVAASVAKLLQANVAQSTKTVFLLGRLTSRRRVAGWYLLAFVEAGLAATLVSTRGQAPRVVATALFVVMTAFAAAAVRFEPASTCGCFGAGTVVSWRTAARGALLAAIAATTLSNAYSHLPGRLPVTAVLVLTEVAILVRLSLPAGPVRTVQQLRYRIHTPACLTSSESLETSLERLEASHAWRVLMVHVADTTEAPVDHWREGCWRFITFRAVEQSGAQVAFAIHLLPGRSSFSGALVSEEGVTLATASSRDRSLRWRKRLGRGLGSPATAG
jgi:hypothetical protein